MRDSRSSVDAEDEAGEGEAPEEAAAPARLAQHPFGAVEREHDGATVGARERLCAPAGAGAQIERDLRCELKEREACGELIAHARLQRRSLIVADTRPIERRPHAARIKACAIRSPKLTHA